jgi:chromosomal replication initiator protein
MDAPSYYVIPGLDREDQTITINMDQVVSLVCEKMKISRTALTTKTSQREILVPRQVAMAFTREFVPYLTLEYIGQHLGGKDHTTVIHAKKTVNSVWMTDKRYGYGPIVSSIHETLKEMKRNLKHPQIVG